MASPSSFASISPNISLARLNIAKLLSAPRSPPRQHEDARAAPTVDSGPVEIEVSVVVSDSSDIDPPMRIVGIGGARSSGAARTCTPTCTS
jgi:hypothetical protein